MEKEMLLKLKNISDKVDYLILKDRLRNE